MKPGGNVTKPARWGLAALACGAALLTAACGSSSSSTASGGSSSPATPSAASSALCADAAALRTALGKLTSIQASAGQGAANEVKTDLANVKAAATTFTNDAKGEWQPQTS